MRRRLEENTFASYPEQLFLKIERSRMHERFRHIIAVARLFRRLKENEMSVDAIRLDAIGKLCSHDA